jgi:hypothetical protein
MTTEKVIAYPGRLFKVVLGSNFGSTNIGWCLTFLPHGIALLAEEIVPLSPRVGTPVQQVFNFVVLDAAQDAKLEFRLIKHIGTIGKDEQLETVEVEVAVVSDSLKSGVSKKRFVEYSENVATYLPVQDDDCTQVLKYGYPPYMKYGYPVASVEGAASCPPEVGSDGTIRYKYGYPAVKYGYPGTTVKYGYPPLEGAKAACEIVQDDCGCYIVKYGYPAVKYGYPGTAVKYGYPPLEGAKAACEIVQDDCGCYIVKYGYPAVKYGYPACQG